MIDERFSAAAFERAGYGSEAARALSKALATEIECELDKTLEFVIQRIISKLNAMGHYLLRDEEWPLGVKVFREPLDKNSQYYKFPYYKLIVGIDILAIVGYPDTVDEED